MKFSIKHMLSNQHPQHMKLRRNNRSSLNYHQIFCTVFISIYVPICYCSTMSSYRLAVVFLMLLLLTVQHIWWVFYAYFGIIFYNSP